MPVPSSTSSEFKKDTLSFQNSAQVRTHNLLRNFAAQHSANIAANLVQQHQSNLATNFCSHLMAKKIQSIKIEIPQELRKLILFSI